MAIKKMKQRSVTPADKLLGQKIRARRRLANISQAELGGVLGISFQQVQKYEKGTNRVGASRLEQIAAALGESVAFFSQSSEPMTEAAHQMHEMMADPLTQRVCYALNSISDKELRGDIVRLLEKIGELI